MVVQDQSPLRQMLSRVEIALRVQDQRKAKRKRQVFMALGPRLRLPLTRSRRVSLMPMASSRRDRKLAHHPPDLSVIVAPHKSLQMVIQMVQTLLYHELQRRLCMVTICHPSTAIPSTITTITTLPPSHPCIFGNHPLAAQPRP